jgi:hypothetical protein
LEPWTHTHPLVFNSDFLLVKCDTQAKSIITGAGSPLCEAEQCGWLRINIVFRQVTLRRWKITEAVIRKRREGSQAFAMKKLDLAKLLEAYNEIRKTGSLISSLPPQVEKRTGSCVHPEFHHHNPYFRGVGILVEGMLESGIEFRIKYLRLSGRWKRGNLWWCMGEFDSCPICLRLPWYIFSGFRGI